MTLERTSAIASRGQVDTDVFFSLTAPASATSEGPVGART